MLPRVLEPEVMDTPEEALAYDAMDHSEVNRVFVDDILRTYAEGGCQRRASQRELDVPAGEWLDLGTGTALIPIELCERVPDVRVVAMDLSLAMLDVARANISVAGLTERIMLVHDDAKRLPFSDGKFAAVISNSIVHHIPDPSGVLAEAWRVLAPGGLVFFRDLLRPGDDETVRRLVGAYAAGATEHQRRMFDDSLRAALTLDEVRALIKPLGVDPESVSQSSDRHWTWAAWKE